MFRRNKFQNTLVKNYGELIQEIAHELRTPLVTIKSGLMGVETHFAKLVDGYHAAQKAGLDIPKLSSEEVSLIKTALKNAESDAHYASSYLNLLAYNFPQTCSVTKELDIFSIKQAITNTVYNFPIKNKVQRNLLDIDFAFADFDVMAVKELVENVFANLIKYILQSIENSGRGKIVIETALQNSGNTVNFIDTGNGLRDSEKQKVFDIFASKNSYKGLGLYFSKQIVESFGGTIECYSPSKGQTCFTVTFPKTSHQNQGDKYD